MRGIVDTESLEIVPQKQIKEFLAGPVLFPGENESVTKQFNESDIPGLNNMRNPVLQSVCVYPRIDSNPPTMEVSGDRYIWCDNTKAALEVDTGGGSFAYLLTVIQGLSDILLLRGRNLWFKFTFLCDEDQET